jgi:hypothetical protein
VETFRVGRVVALALSVAVDDREYIDPPNGVLEVPDELNDMVTVHAALALVSVI